MVPLELQLKNFMSYGEEVTHLDLTNLHTVCLSGENGHGKSALLDALTWALWGETRLGKQGHEQLIRLGADEMSVALTFLVGTDRYRVRRQRNKKTTGQLWELQQDDGGGRWRPLTGVGTTDTGRTIQNLLRMSYDTFLNSAYLRQGRADEFVRQTANKRKEILCEILDLSRYDAYEERARLASREAAGLAAEAQQRLNVIERSISEEPAFRQQLADCLERAKVIEEQGAAIQAELDLRTQERNALQATRAQRERVDRELSAAQADIKRLNQDIATEQAEIVNAQKLVDCKDAITSDYEQLTQSRAESEDLQLKVRMAHDLTRRRMTLENEINAERRNVETELAALNSQLDGIARDQDTFLKYTEEAAGLRTRIADLELLQTRRNAIVDTDMPDARDRFSALKTLREQTDASISAVQTRLQNLANQTETCSICGSLLPPEKIAGIEAECASQIESLDCEKRLVNAEGAQAKKLVDRLNAERDQLDKQLSETVQLRDRLSRIDQEILKLENLRALKPDLEASKAALVEALGKGSYAAKQIAALGPIDAELATLAGVDDALKLANDRVKALADAERHYHALTHAQDSLVTARKRLDAYSGQLQQVTGRSIELAAERDLYGDVGPQLQQLDALLAQIRQGRETNAAEAAQCFTEQGRIEVYLRNIEEHRADSVVRQKERDKYSREEEIYKQLAVAFSKQGIQAIIIESALPELEEDANDILGRISDGALSIKILTTRKAKARPSDAGIIETLDINISDHLGTRPLELYSGGESFRVSFALRIALSKLLARRAGANLQTLIIDEGFGTQDGKGREKLIEAIMAINDDFEKIIVITHIDELKEAFPARVEVVKTPMGSQLTVTDGGYVG